LNPTVDRIVGRNKVAAALRRAPNSLSLSPL
jgi:hypothetical protein